MVSDSTDIGTIFLEIIKCGANLVSEFFMIFSKIFELNYLQRIPAANSLFFTVLSHIYDTRIGELRLRHPLSEHSTLTSGSHQVPSTAPASTLCTTQLPNMILCKPRGKMVSVGVMFDWEKGSGHLKRSRSMRSGTLKLSSFYGTRAHAAMHHDLP